MAKGGYSQKRHCLSAMSIAWLLTKKKTLPIGDVYSVASHKKRHCLSAMSLFWVPGGTRTHDIQNHNLTL